METKNTNLNQQNDLKKKNREQDQDQNQKSRIFNAGELKSDANQNKEYASQSQQNATRGTDYTLTPGQNPEPNTKDPTQPNREWNENEKVDDSKKIYAKGGNVDENEEDARGGEEDIEDEDRNAKDTE